MQTMTPPDHEMSMSCADMKVALFLGMALVAASSTATAPTHSPAPSTSGCHYHGQADECAYVRSTPTCEGTLIDYLALYVCHPSQRSWIIAMYSLWTILVFYLLGTTADRFFCPNLEQLADRMHLSPRLAGVTLLSLGNGAPDIFSAIAAIRDGQIGLVLGDLSGGGMFVCSIVAGGVIAICGELHSSTALRRDVVLYLIVVVALLLALHFQQMNVIAGALMLGYYAAFVGTVVLSDRKRVEGRRSIPTLLAAPPPLDQSPSLLTVPLADELVAERDSMESEDADESVVVSHHHLAEEVQRRRMESITSAPSSHIDSPWLPLRENALILLHLAHDVLKWCEAPFTVLRMLSVVNAVPNEWCYANRSRWIASVAVALAPLLIGFWQGVLGTRVGVLQLWVVLLVVGISLGVIVFLTSSHNHPPPYSTLLILLGFATSAVWIDIFAAELVEVLSAVGYIGNISQLILGITVLAWGNCVGDLTADWLLARNHRQAMAITACYAGPLFNILIGIGVGLLMHGSKLQIKLDRSVLLSFGILAGMLGFTLIITILRSSLTREVSVILGVVYLVYMGVMLWAEVGN